MNNTIDFINGDFAVTGTTLDDIFTAHIIIIIMLGVIAGACIFRHLRK